MKICHKLILPIFCFVLFGCSPKSSIDAIPEAKDIANEFINSFEPSKWDSIESLYGEQFWESMPKEIWNKILPNVYQELGPIESCELATWNQTTRAGTGGSGNYVVLRYGCQHTKYESTITFTVLKPLNDGDAKIVGQNISSLGLLIE